MTKLPARDGPRNLDIVTHAASNSVRSLLQLRSTTLTTNCCTFRTWHTTIVQQEGRRAHPRKKLRQRLRQRGKLYFKVSSAPQIGSGNLQRMHTKGGGRESGCSKNCNNSTSSFAPPTSETLRPWTDALPQDGSVDASATITKEHSPYAMDGKGSVSFTFPPTLALHHAQHPPFRMRPAAKYHST